MKKVYITILCVLILIVASIFVIEVCDLHLYKYNSNQRIHSEWKNSESIDRINNSNEINTYNNIGLLVMFNDKIVGDSTAVNPLIIDLSNEEINRKDGLFSKSYEVLIAKKIQQEFEASTDSTSIRTAIKGKIDYNLKYKFKGIIKNKMAEQMIIDKMMNDVYNEAKEKINLKLPIIDEGNRP